MLVLICIYVCRTAFIIIICVPTYACVYVCMYLVIDRFYIALFSALEQSLCALLSHVTLNE